MERQVNTPWTSLVDQLVGQMCNLIGGDTYRAGSRLPSVRAFARSSRISPTTAAEVYARLVATGHIEARPRVGFYVKKNSNSAILHDCPGTVAKSDPSWRIRESQGGELDSLNLSSGRLPIEWREYAPIKNALKALYSRSEATLTEYGDPQGDVGLRRLLQSRLMDLQMPLQLSQILLTSGASQAVDLVVRYLLKPGDIAVVESPGYCSLINTLRMHGVIVKFVAREPDGPDLIGLERIARDFKPKIFFVQSVLHSPTGSTISLPNAHRLSKLSADYDLTIVENDTYADMLERYVPRLAALEPDRTLHVGSFSKTLSASARVGYICGDERIIHELGKVKAMTSISGAAITEKLIFYSLSAGDYRRSLDRLRMRLGKSMQFCCALLEDTGLVLFCRPLGGKFVWARHPRYADSRDVARLALVHNIVIAPGESFQIDVEYTPWFRINVAVSNDYRFREFLNTL